MELRTTGTYVITGGGGAVAGAVAEVFAEAGASLALVDRNEESVCARAAAVGAMSVGADLGTVAEAQRMIAAVQERFGSIDGLIHTVGGFAAAPAHESDEGLYDRMFDVNVRTLFCTVRAVLPAMLAADDGFIAGISSSAEWNRGESGMTLYAAAKGAVASYLRSLEKELRGTGIRVAIVYPMSPVDTPANRHDMPDADAEKWVDPLEIGRALLFAATRPRRGRLFELPLTATT